MKEIEYRANPAISHSELLKLRGCPAKFKYEMDHPEPPTDAMIFGRAVHKLLLEPDDFETEFAVLPVLDRRTKEGRIAYDEFVKANEGKDCIKPDQIVIADEMVAAVNATPFVKKLLSGDKEKPVFWVDELTAEPCKARFDCLSIVGDKVIIVDYKTTTDASSDAFVRNAINLGYDMQAAMYIEGAKQALGANASFVFIAQEKEPPYAVNIFEADELFVKRGGDIFRELLGIYHECKTSGEWYGYLGKYENINNLGLPAWLAKEIE